LNCHSDCHFEVFGTYFKITGDLIELVLELLKGEGMFVEAVVECVWPREINAGMSDIIIKGLKIAFKVVLLDDGE